MEALAEEQAISYEKITDKPIIRFSNFRKDSDFLYIYSIVEKIRTKQFVNVCIIDYSISIIVNAKVVQLPSALKNIADHIEEAKEILNYADDWDDEGAVATDSNTFAKAVSFIVDYSKYIYEQFDIILNVPYIDILRDGSVSVHWENNEKNQLLIIFKKADEELAFFYAEQSARKIPFKSAIIPGGPVDETLAIWMKNHLS